MDMTIETTFNKKKWARVRIRILERDNYHCCKCDKVVRAVPSNAHDLATVDHIIPMSEGGSHFDHDNLQTLCWGCHLIKNRGQRANAATFSCIYCQASFGKKKISKHLKNKHGIFATRLLLENPEYYLDYEGCVSRLFPEHATTYIKKYLTNS